MKAVVLYSGGLDSSLALAIVKEWGAQVFPLHISHIFLAPKPLPEIPNLVTKDISTEFIKIIRTPQYGYGKNLNPCIDCRILMLTKAREYMEEKKADFIVTGEVLDQRPMSQRLETLMLIEKQAGIEGKVVRPLSGGLLPSTIPEREGLVDRNNLLKMKGRARKFELYLAKKMNITQFYSPGGGCLLTDPGFCRRLADLMRFQETIELGDIELLKIGRHFRLAPETKLIVGRNEQENKKIESLMNTSYTLLYVPDTGSPNALLLGDKKFLKIAAAITARYSDKAQQNKVAVCYKQQKKITKISVKPLGHDELAKWRI